MGKSVEYCSVAPLSADTDSEQKIHCAFNNLLVHAYASHLRGFGKIKLS